MSTDTITFKKVSLEDTDILLQFSRDVFFTAFAHLNHPEDMELYAAKAFAPEQLKEELANPDSTFYFAYLQDAIAGYIKLNYRSAQTEFQDLDALEIERIYVADAFQNKQIGRQMLDLAINAAIADNLKYIWLGVWEHNIKAIRFYERHGFEAFGSHEFMLGNDPQTDLLLKRIL